MTKAEQAAKMRDEGKSIDEIAKQILDERGPPGAVEADVTRLAASSIQRTRAVARAATAAKNQPELFPPPPTRASTRTRK